mgnify:CR=1 FL=1
MVEVREAIVVEGRYDKNTLSQVVKAPVFETSGFGESIRRSACNIVPCYDVLHSFSKEYIVEDLIAYMKKKGVLS